MHWGVCVRNGRHYLPPFLVGEQFGRCTPIFGKLTTHNCKIFLGMHHFFWCSADRTNLKMFIFQK